jgi:5'-methylthioinosine phosphorylase
VTVSKHPTLAIIGGSGFYELQSELESQQKDFLELETPYSNTAVKLGIEVLSGHRVFFLARHGEQHRFPPHRINYRANLCALRDAGVKTIIAINTVGGIQANLKPGHLLIPDQLIDYTWGREHTIFDSLNTLGDHIDFTHPFTQSLREIFIAAATKLDLAFAAQGCVGCTQGPRLETAAEIQRLEKDGCDAVGMTMMPEASLARELKMDYASIALVVNRAAGLDGDSISIEMIQEVLVSGHRQVRELIRACLPALVE